MTTNVTVTTWKYPDDVKALYYVYDLFRQSEEVGGDVASMAIIPEPIRFARYFLDHPEKWKEVQDIAEQAEEWLEAQGRPMKKGR